MQTLLEQEMVIYAGQLDRYFRDPAWAEQQEEMAKRATDGNISAIEGIASALNTRLERFLGTNE